MCGASSILAKFSFPNESCAAITRDFKNHQVIKIMEFYLLYVVSWCHMQVSMHREVLLKLCERHPLSNAPTIPAFSSRDATSLCASIGAHPVSPAPELPPTLSPEVVQAAFSIDKGTSPQPMPRGVWVGVPLSHAVVLATTFPLAVEPRLSWALFVWESSLKPALCSCLAAGEGMPPILFFHGPWKRVIQ